MDPSTAPDASASTLMRDQNYVTAMSHFYRGELGRIMIWRQRLDATTTWAITTSTIFTVAFTLREVPHLIFFFQPRHRRRDALDRSAALPILRRLSRARANAGSTLSRTDVDVKRADD